MANVQKITEEMYIRYAAAVYQTALTFTHQPSLAEDVLQEVFAAFYQQLGDEKHIRHPRAWLLTATRNRSLNLLRDRGREVSVEQLLDAEVQDPTEDIGQQDVVSVALSVLNEAERLVFSLHHLDGYTYKDIALGLEIPIGTVQTRCHTATQKLRKRVKELDIEGRSHK